MDCRGGIVVGGGNSASIGRELNRVGEHAEATPAGRTHWRAILFAVLTLSLVLTLLPGRRDIAPLIESDYCYLMLAADRLYEGLGLASLQPVAPMQAWEWRYDWGFLTQWPAGYSILLFALRWTLGCTTLEASRVVCIVGCAAALVGWFSLIRRCIPPGLTGGMLATLAATSCVSVGSLVNPSTDLILIATLPFILLLVADEQTRCKHSPRSAFALIAAGLASGGLFWFRYASLFVPVAIIAVLALEFLRNRFPLKSVVSFTASAVLPIVALLALNSVWGQAEGAPQRFNLGSKFTPHFSFAEVARAWWTFSNLGYYPHKPFARWATALLPLAFPLVLLTRSGREITRAFASRMEFKLALSAALAMLGLIVGAGSFFGSKFDYIGLERYYLPGRPLFVVLLFAPLVCIPRRTIRCGTMAAVVLFLWYTLAHEWTPTYQRWVAADRPRTPSGAWSRVFEPHAVRLYEWLREEGQPRKMLVFSNFHEYVALETGVAVLPVPDSVEAFERILDRARLIRHARNPLSVFVLNPDNLWRDYWMKSPQKIVEDLGLEPWPGAPPELQSYLFVRSRRPELSIDMDIVESDFACLGIDHGDGLRVGAE